MQFRDQGTAMGFPAIILHRSKEYQMIPAFFSDITKLLRFVFDIYLPAGVVEQSGQIAKRVNSWYNGEDVLTC